MPLPQLTFCPDRFSNLRFLIVEDNYPAGRLICDVLRAAGAKEAFTAPNGQCALELLSFRRPDVIVTDWKMPVMDGIEMSQIIRRAVITPDSMIPDPRVPIVMLTGRHAMEDIVLARNVGINEFVIKPLSPASLLSRIETTLRRPRGFMTGAGYVGPDRRRKLELYYCGELRRIEDPKPVKNSVRRDDIREIIYAEMEDMRTVLTTRREMNREAINMTLVVLEQSIYRARQLRDLSIQRAAEELLDYLQSLGTTTTESQRIDAYLESINAFCSLLVMSAPERVAPAQLRIRA